MALAIITALTVIALRLILFGMDMPPQGTDFMLVHFLAIVTVVFFADLKLLRTSKRSGFPDLVREGFKSAAVYALLLTAFLWIYFASIETGSFERRIEELVFRAVEEGASELEARHRFMGFFTPFNYASMSFFALLAIGGVNALVIGAIHHKVLRRAMR